MTLQDWSLPDNDLCSAALDLMRDASPTVIANHNIRSYLFARELAAARGLRSNVDYDDELVFLACILHDLGVTDMGAGDQRFEVEGADAAARFLREHEVSEDRVMTVWQSIALHSSVGLAHRFGPEQAVTFSGISLDIDGFEKGLLHDGFAERVHTQWPRHDVGYALAHIIADGTRRNPAKAPPFTLPAHLHQLINGAEPLSFFALAANNGWGDQPVSSADSTLRG
jgi:hypothetical protein